jgi:hypothetical protein
MGITKRRIAHASLVALGTLVAGAGALAVAAAWSLKQELADIAGQIELRRVESGQRPRIAEHPNEHAWGFEVGRVGMAPIQAGHSTKPSNPAAPRPLCRVHNSL